jgi:pimeloyl-ACP methyl ester carboxylesterase
MSAIVDAIMQRFFSPDKQDSAWAQSTRRVLLGSDPKGYAACCAALRDTDMRASLSRISVPALIIGGERDPSTPWEGNGSILAADIPGARTVLLQTAHLSNLEEPIAFTHAVRDFLLSSAGKPQ